MGTQQTAPVDERLTADQIAFVALADQKLALDQHVDVSMTDCVGTILYANEKFCDISQYSKDELIGQNHRILSSGHHPKEFFQQMYRTITSGVVWHGELKNRAKDGSMYWVAITIVPILDPQGVPRQYVAIRSDITERKRVGMLLEQRQNAQLKFKDEFLSHVSHELRSPLTAIKQFTSILLGGLAGELNAEQREFQQIILKNVLQLQSMIDDLLDITRLETGKLGVELESMSVSDAVNDCFNTMKLSAKARGLTLSLSLPADLPPVHADGTRLRQVLTILLDNAVKFTPRGGAVTIQAQLLPEHPQFMLLQVSDTGCGVRPEAMERIFERLYQSIGPAQASRKGLGLGLFICKQLVKQHHGHIWVTSQPNRGSTFSFAIPVFSLRNVIAPLLINDKWPTESVALVRVENQSTTPSGWIEEVRTLVNRCLIPNLNVLLPKTGCGTEAEGLFVAAFENEASVSLLANRIREQYERLPESGQSGLPLSVSYTMLKRLQPIPGASVENIVASMATYLEQSIKSEVFSKAAHHE
jgi:PAS domain S-box-containing protein